MKWVSPQTIEPTKFICGYCNHKVGAHLGYKQNGGYRVAICPNCERPSFIYNDVQVPDASPGMEINNLPDKISKLYKEARNSVSIGAHTGAVLLCRKLLMNIAVELGARENKGFLFYVEYLEEENYIPKSGKVWVDHIRNKGNEANHDIIVMSKNDSIELIQFMEMLLKIIYEFPMAVPSKKEPQKK